MKLFNVYSAFQARQCQRMSKMHVHNSSSQFDHEVSLRENGKNCFDLCCASEFSSPPGEPVRFLSMFCWDGSVVWFNVSMARLDFPSSSSL